MRARDLATACPTVTYDTPASDAARLLAAGDLPGLIVVDSSDTPVVVLTATGVLRLAVPIYIQDDPALAQVVDEATADVFLRELGGCTVRDCLPQRPPEPAVVTGEATVLEVAALMARTRSPLVAVVDQTRTLIGVVTLHALLDRILGENA